MKKFTVLPAFLCGVAAAASPLYVENFEDGKTAWSYAERKLADGGYALAAVENGADGKVLHLKDENGGHANQSVKLSVPRRTLLAMRGKKVFFYGKAKVVSASGNNLVGIGIFAVDGQGKKFIDTAMVDASKTSGFVELKASLQIPPEFRQLSFQLLCAKGWNNKAEAFFDDLEISLEDRRIQAAAELPAVKKSGLPVTAKILPLLENPPYGWNRSVKGGAKLSGNKLTLPPKGRLLFSTPFISTLIENGTPEWQLKLVSDRPLPVTVKFLFAGKIRAVDAEMAESFKENGRQVSLFRCRASGQLEALEISSRKKLVFALFEAALQGEKLTTGAHSPEMKALVKEFQGNPVFTSDNWKRPVIRNGNWYLDGRPVFWYGPFYGALRHAWEKDPLKIQHFAYLEQPSREILEKMGFNSEQISSAPSTPGMILFGSPVDRKGLQYEVGGREHYAKLTGMPLMMDFAYGYWQQSVIASDPDYGKSLNQRNPEWHQFIPFCPECPDGRRYYECFFRGGTISLLRKGANSFCYELFNESSYNCQCIHNLRRFAREMKRQYGTIAEANKIWGSSLSGFGELEKLVGKVLTVPGVWPDWCKFSAKRYAEILLEFRDVIRSVDRRPNVYFTEMCSLTNFYETRGATMDYREIAKAMDVIGIEGGWRYGGNSSVESTNPMDDAATAKSISYSFGADFARSLAKGRKPVVNNEHYCGRFEQGKRVPSRAEDMITSMWGEIAHGVSASYHYNWGKRAFEWKGKVTPKSQVFNGGYKSYNTLNPYNWPLEELQGFPRFTAELEPYRDLVMPFPRRKEPSSTAIFYSYPSLRRAKITGERFRDKMFAGYSALLFGQYPLEFVFEEELAAGLPPETRVLLLPCASHLTPETLLSLKKFAARGGRIIADKEAFQFDEFGKRLPKADFPYSTFDAVGPKGQQQAQKLLENSGAFRPVQLSALPGGKPFVKTELHAIDRGDFHFLIGISWMQERSRLGLLQWRGLSGKYYLSSVLLKKAIPGPAGDCWSAEELAKGVKIPVPPQERFLYRLDRKLPAGFKVAAPAELKAAFDAQLERDKKHEIIRAGQLKEINDILNGNRMFKLTGKEKFQTLPLTALCNRKVFDEVAGDGRGGWFDQGNNDFARMPEGVEKYAGVPFYLVGEKENQGKRVIILKGGPFADFPVQAGPLEINRKCRALYFLHTAGWNAPAETPIVNYVITYEDGTEKVFNCRNALEIQGWWGAVCPTNGKVALISSNGLKPVISMQAVRWVNPTPQKQIRSLKIVSAAGPMVPVLAAVTAELL